MEFHCLYLYFYSAKKENPRKMEVFFDSLYFFLIISRQSAKYYIAFGLELLNNNR